jgi:hypothetical protein
MLISSTWALAKRRCHFAKVDLRQVADLGIRVRSEAALIDEAQRVQDLLPESLDRKGITDENFLLKTIISFRQLMERLRKKNWGLSDV